MKEMKIKVLDWSGNSSDLKSIGICGQSSSSAFVVKNYTTKTKLIEAIIGIWFKDPEIKKKVPQVSGFDAKSNATIPEKSWWSYHVLKLVYRVKNCSCMKISENVLVFGHYAINLQKSVAIGNWNVSPLTGKKQELAWEAQQHRLDIVGVSSTNRRVERWIENFLLRR